jgi:hypothetical protein
VAERVCDGAVVTSAVTFIVLLIVVLGKWNLSSALSGAEEVNESLTAFGTYQLVDYALYDEDVKSLRNQRWILLAVVLAAVALTAVLTPCFYEPDFWEREEAVKGLEAACVLAMLFTGCIAIMQIAIASLNLELGQSIRGLAGGVPGSWWSRPLWIGMIVVAVATLILPIVALSVREGACSALPPPRRLLVVSIFVVLGLVLMQFGVAISATRASPTSAFRKFSEMEAQLGPVCGGAAQDDYEEGPCTGLRGKFNAVGGLVETVAVVSGLCIQLVFPFFLRVVMTTEWRCGSYGRVGDGP